MTIPLFSQDVGQRDSYPNLTVQIPGYYLSAEIYSRNRTLVGQGVYYADHFLVVIKQSTGAVGLIARNLQPVDEVFHVRS